LEAKQEQQRRTAKKKRGYHRIQSGVSKAVKLGIPLYRLDLTLKPSFPLDSRQSRPGFFKELHLNQYLQTLRKRIERHYRIKLQYAAVRARGDKGGKIHLHIVYWASTLSGKPIFNIRQSWINKFWLSNAWQDITGSKITFIRAVRNTQTSRKKVVNYFIGQYFSGQNQFERMSYSQQWLFKGACKVWNIFSAYYQDQKQAVLSSWTDLLTSTLPIPKG